MKLSKRNVVEPNVSSSPSSARRWPVRGVLSNNLGFGGQNASMVFRAV